MRALIVVAGTNAAAAGLAVAAHQTVLWLQSGYWSPVLFSDLWFALGGAAPELLRLHGVEGLVATLLDQPLSVVLLIGGACMAWIATERTIRHGVRI
jgi:hypothetical protein